MIGLEVVNLFPEDQRPHVFAQELDHIERVVETGPVAGESVRRWAPRQPGLDAFDAGRGRQAYARAAPALTSPPGPVRLGSPGFPISGR